MIWQVPRVGIKELTQTLDTIPNNLRKLKWLNRTTYIGAMLVSNNNMYPTLNTPSI